MPLDPNVLHHSQIKRCPLCLDTERLEACREDAYRLVSKNEMLCGDWPAEDYENLLTLLASANTAFSPSPADKVSE